MNGELNQTRMIVNSKAGNNGKFVRCLRLLKNHLWFRPDGSFYRAPGWVTDRALRSCRGKVDCLVPDEQLMPVPNNIKETT